MTSSSKRESYGQSDWWQSNRRQFLRRLLIVGAGMPLAPMLSVGASWAGLNETPTKRSSSVDLGATQIKTSLEDYRNKMRYFDKSHPEDIWVSPEEFKLLQQVKLRLDGVYKMVGHSRFYLVDFDETLKVAQTYSQVGGPFTKVELDFLEALYHRPAADYGFYGLKPLGEMTHRVNRNEIVKIQGTGNYLYRGDAEKLYQRMRSDVGNHLMLTSGVRNVVKQFHLFLKKVVKTKGNLSRASRSLAPPGYSFHGVSDFDVGQANFGLNNFTSKFIESSVYQQVHQLDYFKIRYTRNNMLGVRYEPWHVRVEKA